MKNILPAVVCILIAFGFFLHTEFAISDSSIDEKQIAAIRADSNKAIERRLYVRTPETIKVSSYLPRAVEHGNWLGSWTASSGRKEVGGSYTASWSEIGGEWKIHSEIYVTLFCNGPGC